jgi:hypothetical protein
LRQARLFTQCHEFHQKATRNPRRLDHERREMERSAMASDRIGFHTARIQIARAGVGLAAALGLLGSVISFVPGAEVGWFGVATAAALAGLLSPARRLRVVAVVLAVALAGLAWAGHVRGRQYREWLRHQPGLPGARSPLEP